jgi:membrane protease YdiL (CAAX protease family)
MSQSASDYFRATRHPRACVLFVLPLLVLYETGVVLLDAQQGDNLRNGADTWVRWTLAQIGLGHPFVPGLLLGLGLLCWGLLSRKDRPHELPNVWMGMMIESAVFALGLWGVGCLLARTFALVQVPLALNSQPEPAMQHLVSFLGAGIYEEVLFRLLLLTFMLKLFEIGELSHGSAISLAVTVSALVFAAAHHVGAAGEPFDGFVFLFRTAAGVFFGLLLQWRGLGIAVGAHAGYDVLVGLVLPTMQ